MYLINLETLYHNRIITVESVKIKPNRGPRAIEEGARE